MQGFLCLVQAPHRNPFPTEKEHCTELRNLQGRFTGAAAFLAAAAAVLLRGDGSPVSQSRFNHDGTFHPFLFQLTGEVIGLEDAAAVGLAVGVAAAAAIELGPAIAAVLLAIDGGGGKLFLHLQVDGLSENIPHLPFRMSHKLMTRINVTVRGDRHILVAGSAAPEAFVGAGSLIQVQH